MSNKEKVLLFAVYSDDGELNADVTNDADVFQLYGFLERFVSKLKKDLEGSMRGKQ